MLRPDFLDGNYLSDDQRHSVNELGTNAQRAEGTNAQAGSTWGQMSSQTYKDIRAPRTELVDYDAQGKAIPLYDPLTGKHDNPLGGSDRILSDAYAGEHLGDRAFSAQ